jgi:peptidoglycan/xylan/chitin deacetylase (PgdA/CDA1 family)
MKKVICFFSLTLIIFISGGCRSITKTSPELGEYVAVLSFDDGPNSYGDSTGRLLDILKKYNIRAIFSLLGENTERNPELTRRIRDEGHIIVNHGYSDKWASGMNDREFRENLEKGEAAIAGVLGEPVFPKLYRPHGGYYTDRQEKIWQDLGWTMVPSGIRAYDAVCGEKEKKKIVAQIIKKTEKNSGGIILLHDGRDSQNRINEKLEGPNKDRNISGPYNRSWIVDATEEIITALLEKGYVFKTPVY